MGLVAEQATGKYSKRMREWYSASAGLGNEIEYGES